MKNCFTFLFLFFITQQLAAQKKDTLVSVKAFYIDESEISSNEYRQYDFSGHTEEDATYHYEPPTDTVVKRKVIRPGFSDGKDFYLLQLQTDSNHISIHQQQAEEYDAYDLNSDAEWDSLRFVQSGLAKKITVRNSRACHLNKRVYGWHPYWSNGLQTNYDWNGLTDLCYFSYDVNSANGNATSTHNWSTATVVTDAQANGVNVTLCATLFSGHTAFFASSTSQQTLITNLINLVQSRNAHGVNIDFEGMSASHSAAFTTFMINLCNQMHTAIPGSEVSIALYAVDWGGVFNMAALNPYVDLFIIMGYDYYYSGSSTAGPEDPLYSFQASYNYTLTKSITYYLKQGASKSKLLLGLPWYGREWTTSAGTIPSATTGAGTNSVTYATMRDNTNGYYSSRQWDATSFSSWFPSQRGGVWWQAFIDDKYSMGKRLDIVNQRGIGGIGIWALGYDDGYSDFWDMIREKFTDCAVVPCTDTIYDMGGPNRNYYDNEDFTYTIAPTGATGLSLDFSSFATEPGYDTLWIYNGTTILSPLVGSYNGSSSPGTITASGNALTIRFKSDNATQAAGWQAIWTCSMDNVAPTTTVTAPTNWVTSDFTTSFTDTDNTGGSGISKSFYQVLDYNGTEWRSNNGNGFFSDNFNNAIHPEWTSAVGSWSIASAALHQSDETNANTNLYASLTQNLSDQYLYNFRAKIDGTGTNRRAGFHFFCDDASQTNRGNSYFVWFRVDQSVCEFYKVTGNVFSLESSSPMTVNAGQWYDYKIIYDRTNGKMDVYQDNNFIGNWTDPNPLTNGNAISFRTGNCDFMADDLNIYRSRLSSATVSVGAAVTNDVRYQNPNPSTPSGRIRSVTKDATGNLSAVAAQDVNIDWTIPTSAIISDGFAADVDTSYSLSQLSANWTVCSDTNSAIIKYWYAIGSSAGTTDISGWTDNGITTSATAPGLSLTAGQTYYFMVRSEDGAGLLSDSTISDGQVVMLATGITETEEQQSVHIFPNPFSENTIIDYTLQSASTVEITLLDLSGKQLKILSQQEQPKGRQQVMIDKSALSLAKGMYILNLRINKAEKNYKLIVN